MDADGVERLRRCGVTSRQPGRKGRFGPMSLDATGSRGELAPHRPVVTVAALYRAGGSVDGPRVAERLGVPLLDREIPEYVARRTGLPEGGGRQRHRRGAAQPHGPARRDAGTGVDHHRRGSGVRRAAGSPGAPAEGLHRGLPGPVECLREAEGSLSRSGSVASSVRFTLLLRPGPVADLGRVLQVLSRVGPGPSDQRFAF
jgi:hypothetical protein